MVDYPIVTEKTALILIGMENDWLRPGAPFENADAREQLVPRLKRLKDGCRAKGIKVIYLVHTHRKDGSDLGMEAVFWPQIAEGKAVVAGTDGVQIYRGIKLEEGDIVVEKHRYSGFCGTDLDLLLKSIDIDTVIIAGSGINLGLETTARDAAVRDYKVIFASDGHRGRDLPDLGWGPVPLRDLERVVLTTLASAFAQVIPIAGILRKIAAKDSEWNE
ncbi:MAG: cysteine hydrolase [Chloroflexi bacterium]|nr:cysteine hydrolase [Chloroflexota bacterium]